MMKRGVASSSMRNPRARRRRIDDDNDRISKRSITSAAEHRPFTEAEDEIIIRARIGLGDNWATIAGVYCGRTGDAIVDRWNAIIFRRSPTNPSASIGRDFFNSTPRPPAAVGSSASDAIDESWEEDDPMTRLTLTPPGYCGSDRREVYDKKAEVNPPAAVWSSSFVATESEEDGPTTRLTLTPLGY